MTPMPAFQYDVEQQAYIAQWDDCAFTGTKPSRDHHGDLSIDLRAVLPTGELLELKRLKLLDTWSCQQFAKACAATPDAQQKVLQYLSQFADHLTRALDDLPPHSPREGVPILVTLDTVTGKPVPWLWWPYIPLQALTMLDGDPGIGKSLLTIQLAATLSRGYPFPDQQGKPTLPTGPPCATLFLAGEDSLEYTMRPRIDACGGDPALVHVLTGWKGAEDEEHVFTLADMDILRQALAQTRPRLVVIDPLQAYMGARVDINRSNEVIPLLRALDIEARRYDCAVLCVRHQAKASGQAGGKAMMRGLGTVSFTGHARSVLLVEQHPVEKDLAMLGQSKTNSGAPGRTQRFSKEDGIFAWAGVTRMNVEVLGGNARGPDPHAFFEVFCWLEQRLAGGLAWPSKDLETELEEEGFKKDTIRRAKKTLGVISQKQTDYTWTWRLTDIDIIQPPLSVISVTSFTSTTSVTSTTSAYSNISDTYRNEGEETEERQGTVETEDTEVAVVSPSCTMCACESNMSREGDISREKDISRTRETTDACPECGATAWHHRLTFRLCQHCQYRQSTTP